MRHPFDGVNAAPEGGLTRRAALGALAAAGLGLFGGAARAADEIAPTGRFREEGSRRLGEAGGPVPSTRAVGEEGGVTTFAVGEEGGPVEPINPPVTTNAIGEEGGEVTLAIGENGGPIFTTLAIGEEGGPGPNPTTLALGEEGGPIFTTLALGEEGGGAS